MYCKNCGEEIGNQAFCPKCGTAQTTSVQQGQFQAQGAPQMQAAPVDNGGFLWGLLGCCIPIVGLILFLVWKDSKPRTAKAAGIGALISVVISVIWYAAAAVAGVGAGYF